MRGYNCDRVIAVPESLTLGETLQCAYFDSPLLKRHFHKPKVTTKSFFPCQT